ncbi:biopolymer transporter ExbD [Pleionea sp. CnH1-48]|uniref:ExbD/TolR family protein n=1 Tax=Pleionea sp. CnH1-48 TaxID=2954494 RepID=UPI0020985269|nr:biopolymer transporter ExbD [Pleionea sp. CnH1-48]MCO7225439.1 biopolymer transporter ExbD [Pleionea sp. CnH1-48]
MPKQIVRRPEEESEIDMTPMLDIVFIMLIFFIVTTSFVKEAGIQVLKPEAKTAVKKKDANVFIGVSSTGEVYMDKKKVELERLKVEIQRIKAESPEGAVVIQADKGSKAGVIMKVLDAAKGAGVKDISVAAAEGG